MAKPVLYINGEALDMGALAAITVERHNPLLSEGQQSYSYPFTIPRTGRNERLLGFPARFQRARAASPSFACELACGHVRRVGTLHINGVAQHSYDCSMTYDTAALLRGIGKKKLSELAWEVVEYGSRDELFAEIRDSYLGVSDFFADKAATFKVVINIEEVNSD